MRPLDVGIIGAGTAGAAAAVFLGRAGHRVTLYERVPSPRAVGAGITLQPTGLHVLCRLGMYSQVVARGARIERILCETRTGRPLVDLTYASIGADLFGLGLHRGVLFEALHAEIERLPAITIRRGVEIVDLARGEGRAGQRLSWLVDAQRERHGPHELVVVADGARSQLRDDTGTSKRVEPYPWGALWFVGKDARPADHGHERVLYQVADGNGRFVGLLPTGTGPREHGRADPLVSLFWSVRCDRVGEWRSRGLQAWKDEVRELAPATAPILDQIVTPDQVLFAIYHDVVMHRWSTRNVVYLGDAAHATSPQLGQGANLALWDAMVLADVLAAEERDLACALDVYSRERAGHLGFYQFATRFLTPFFQGDEPLLGSLRDLAMPIAARIGITNRIMTLGMLGVVDGFGGRTLTLRLPRPDSGGM